MTIRRPMLAATAPNDLEQLRYPLYISMKLDGIRCLVHEGVAYSRTLKPIPNLHIQEVLSDPSYAGFDGELLCGNMQETMSAVMSRHGQPDFRFHVFDYWPRGSAPFIDTLPLLKSINDGIALAVPQELATTAAELETLEQEYLASGHEGAIARAPFSPYKHNRSTLREHYLLKIKRFVDDEAVVIGYEERLHNANPAERSELGLTKRSSHQENKLPTNSLGALVCQLPDGTEFNVGTGFDEYDRHILWQQREQLLGRTITFKSFKQSGVKDKPRHPVFKCFRDPRDL